MPDTEQQVNVIDRREAIRRVSALLGGAAFIGGTTLIAACEKRSAATSDTATAATAFTPEEVAYLDEIADTILPDTPKSPGAKAAKTGAFMALMVTDSYEPKDQQTFRAGMKTLDDESKTMNKVGFMQATPAQRLALLEKLDKEAKEYMDAREKAGATAKSAQAARPIEQAPQGETGGKKDTAQQATTGSSNPATAITADAPSHYFRMMKELAMLGYFTSEIGYTKAMRYQETPGRYDPCLPYAKGEVSWASHA